MPLITDQTLAEGPEGEPAPKQSVIRADDPRVTELVDKALGLTGHATASFDTKLVRDLVLTSLKLVPDGRHTGELKLITAAVKEMRHAYRVFGRYPDPHKVTIFGSARTPEDHPDFTAAVEFSRLMAEAGWMIITGAGMGIMAAGHVGPGRDASFGVAIRLPFETNANHVIAGDEKLIHFRYFFTRKLMFVSQAEAVVLFPGGFGTMDEAFETLTLVQTGKAAMMPIVLCEGAGGSYWPNFDRWLRSELLERHWISPEDTSLYYIAPTPAEAVAHIQRFYSNYHSSRYVHDDYVIRVHKPITDARLDDLNREFADLVKTGRITQRGPYEEEQEHLHLARISFTHNKGKYGRVRQLVDRINDYAM